MPSSIKNLINILVKFVSNINEYSLMFFNILKHALSRGSIIITNQLSVLIAIPILASRLDFFIFGQVAIGFVLVQLSWVISDWGVQHFSIENWSRAKTLRDKNRLISLLLSLRLSNGRRIPTVVFSSQQNSTNHDFANIYVSIGLFARHILFG